MLQGMDPSEFGQFVATLWEQQGWETKVKRDGDKTFVAAQRPKTGEEGLLWAIPAGEDEVGGKQVQQFAKLCQQHEVEESAIVTAGAVSQHARKAASSTGIELLDGDGVATFVRQRDLGDLVRKFGGDGGSGSSDGSANGGQNGGSPLASILGVVEAVGARASRLVGGTSPVSGKAVVALVVVLAVVATGVLYGPSLSLPFLGDGGGEDGPLSTEPAPNGSVALHVGWNAKVVDTIDPNESDDSAFYAPEGEQFVLVRLNVTNVGEEEVPVKQAGFKLRAENTTYGYQPLAGADGFMDHPMPPGRNYKGWTVFTVPKGTTGTLVYRANATVGVEFERESDLPVNVEVY